MEVDPSAMTEAGAAPARPHDLGPGVQIGKYRLDHLLGAGGMGEVWAAFDPDLERSVAIKVLRSIDSGGAQRTRLLREARAMARLKHPNVLTVYDVGTDRNRDYIAMELIDGADLHAWLASKPPQGEIFDALLAAGRGLAAAHDAGLIHRDLKPHNILRGRDGGVYVTDFGLARGQIENGIEVVQRAVTLPAIAVAAETNPHAFDSVLDSPLTQTGALIGTPAYMAPEQFTGRSPDPRSDQFAFCVTAWEALTGARPFFGKTLDELRMAATAGAPGEGELPPPVRSVLARGLSPTPAARWPDMHALLRQLATAFAPVRRSRARLIALAVIAAAIVVVGYGWFMHKRAPSITDCAPAEDAFGSAWSRERREAVTARHRSNHMLMAVTAALDETRRKWIRFYEATCEKPASAQRHERLACLFEARDEIDAATKELTTDDAELSVEVMIPGNVAIGVCNIE